MIGKTVSHYKILEKVGSGGMGVVYKATDIKLGRFVALKFLPHHLGQDDEEKQRFIHEAKAASALQHNNICTIHEIDETDDEQLYICMDYYEGQTLKKKNTGRPLPIEEVIDISTQIAEGLAKAHEKDIVHRDLKPANVMLTNDSVVKILDFGLAKLGGQTRLTKAGTTLGTAAYMSPEQARGEEVDHRTDIFSLGVLIYEMVTGQLPFKGDYEQVVIYSILNEEPEPITRLQAGVPPKLEQIVNKAMTKNSANRYQHLEQMLSSLRSLKRETNFDALNRRATKSARRKRPSRYVAVIGLAVFLIAGSYFLWQRDERSRIQAAIEQLQPVIEQGRLDDLFYELQALEVNLNDIDAENFVKSVAGTLSIDSEPPGAKIALTRVQPISTYSTHQKTTLGLTPIRKHLLIAGEYMAYLTKDEMSPLEFIIQVEPGKDLLLSRHLLPLKGDNKGMVMVGEGVSIEGSAVPAFFIDRTEVTNAEFLKFVAVGGYRDPALWPETMIIEGQPTDWTSAMQFFVDRTAIPGPRFWSGGRYPDGKGDHPVTGISWYEATAHARWAGKELPTKDQWYRAALGEANGVLPWGSDVESIELRANFGMTSDRPVGSHELGVSPFGCFDMAGNVSEWLQDSAKDKERRTIVGGSWQHPTYMFEPAHAESFVPAYSSESIGFRCVKAISKP